MHRHRYWMQPHLTCLVLFIACLTGPSALAQQPPTTQITTEQFQQLLGQQEQMRREIEQLKAERAAAPATQPAAPASSNTGVTQEDIQDINEQMRKLQDQVHAVTPGLEHLVILGDASVNFVNQQGSPSTFAVGFSPLFLWEPTDRLLFEAALDVGVNTDFNNNSTTSVNLTIADASYIVNDYLILGGGLFVVPFGQYHNHFDPPWINKLPDDPLVFNDGGLAPSSQVGIFGRGAAPIGSTKITYDAYLTNGPNLIVNDPAAAGSLNYSDFTDLNNGKAVGGRIGFLPIPSMEFGYSLQWAQTAPNNFAGRNVDAFLQALDFNWVQEFRPLGGVVTARAEWVWNNIAKTTYDPTGKLGFGPITFGNYRNGGYALLSYRPTLATNEVLRKLEFVFRYDSLKSPLSAPGGDYEQRYAFGIDYWLTPSWVLKVAYEIDNKKVGPDQNAFFVQLGIGL